MTHRPHRFDAVIFDLDGTLVDSAPDIHAAACATLADHGLASVTRAQARSYVGHGAAIFITRLRAEHTLPDSLQEPLLATFLEHYETAHDLTEPYPGAIALMDRIAHEGTAIGLVTNKPISPTNNLLTHLGWTDRFAVTLGGDSLPVRKPDPAPLLQAIETLGCTAPLYVGDSEVDAETATRAGVPFALFTEGYRKTPVEDLPHMLAFSTHNALENWLFPG
jgi:phosphoglycolate phosphatase